MKTYKTMTSKTAQKRQGMVASHEGGMVYKSEPFTRLKRWLVLGSGTPSFYETALSLSRANISNLYDCLKMDAQQTIDTIVEVSTGGLAPSNEEAILALAYAASYGLPLDTSNVPEEIGTKVRKMAFDALPQVARTGSHLLHFCDYISDIRGWSPQVSRDVLKWYQNRSPLSLAKQVTKYAQRDGWSHADVLTLCHAKPNRTSFGGVVNYVLNDGDLTKLTQDSYELYYLNAVNKAKSPIEKQELVELIRDFELPREVLATDHLKEPEVWYALTYAMPIHALLRNLGNFAKHGLLKDGSHTQKFILSKLQVTTLLHPLDVFKALRIYQAGRSELGSGTWEVSQLVCRRLEELFYESFKSVEPSNAYLYVGLDISGSMSLATGFAGHTTAAELAAVMAMITVRTEPNAVVYGFNYDVVDLGITPNMGLKEVIHAVQRKLGGGTNCAAPIEHALRSQMTLDGFVYYTDSESATSHTGQRLRQYKKEFKKDRVPVAVNAMISNNVTLLNPHDRDILDIPGLSSATPAIVSAFMRGDL